MLSCCCFLMDSFKLWWIEFLNIYHKRERFVWYIHHWLNLVFDQLLFVFGLKFLIMEGWLMITHSNLWIMEWERLICSWDGFIYMFHIVFVSLLDLWYMLSYCFFMAYHWFHLSLSICRTFNLALMDGFTYVFHMCLSLLWLVYALSWFFPLSIFFVGLSILLCRLYIWS